MDSKIAVYIWLIVYFVALLTSVCIHLTNHCIFFRVISGSHKASIIDFFSLSNVYATDNFKNHDFDGHSYIHNVE